MPKELNNSSSSDLLTIGDCSIDLFMKIPDNASNIQTEHADNLAKMCFLHGSKIMVEGFSTSISGNSVNVAIGTSLLGIKTAIYTETGDDENAKRISNELKDRNVKTTYVITNPKTDTALHAVIVYSGERTIFSYHGKRHYSIKNWPQPKFIYYTSIGEGFEDFQKELIDYVKKTGVGLAFNPGTFQMAKGIEALKNVLEITDILFVNKEEAQQLTKMPIGTNLTDLHKAFSKMGVKLSVITDGKNGASAFDGTSQVLQPAFIDNKPILDMTGAGDAFSAGFMSALIYGKDLKEALKWGVVESAAQIKVVGSVAGMLTKDQLTKLI